MKISKIIKIILISLVTLFIMMCIPNNTVEAATKPKVKVSYSYDKKKDVVTVKVKSNIKFRNTKPSWTLSKNKKTYTKKFYKNEKYTTTFKFQNGSSKKVKVKVKQIKGPQLKITYKYEKDKNKVKVNVSSNKKFKDTKPTWSLSKGKKTYTKFFKVNQTYKTTFYDLYGNKKTIKIKVNQIDDKAPEVKVTYDYNEDNSSCEVKITSNEEMKRSVNEKWILSNDKKVYTRTFNANTKFNVTLKDKYSNKVEQTIDINKIIKKVNNVSSSANSNIKKDVYNGIDVSCHNDKVDWTKIKESGIDFAIIRCGFGKDTTSQDDSTFRYNINECKRLSIPYGVYIYSYALNTDDAISEASHVLRLIKGYEPKYGIWFDMEDADGYKKKNGMPSNDTLVDICDVFCKEIKKNGYNQVGIYANLDWWNNRLNSSKLDVYDKWVAQWGEKCTYGKKYVMWQYTSDGSADGIIGRVDMNYCYKTF